MKVKNLTLRKQFNIELMSGLLIIALFTGTIQLYFMKQQIVNETSQQAQVLAKDVLRGIEQTELSTKTIERQIDLKLLASSKHIASLLEEKPVSQITQTELLKIKNDLGLAGITIFQETESKNDVVGTVATEPGEIGFSFKSFGYYAVAKQLLSGEKPVLVGATYTDTNILVLPIAQSGSHKEKPEFFKYAYYHDPETNYFISPYIKANEVYDYTEIVGPDARINELVKENNIVKEIAVLNPKVFKDPSLEKQLYPPLKKIEAGNFDLQSKKDNELLTQSTIKKESYIERVNGEKVYKMFMQLDDNRVIYLALDYGKMSGPLYQHSIILIVSGLISLLVLFLVTARFFNRIYENIQKIINQINFLEDGDLTAKSEVSDGSELEKLSQSTNRMVDKLNKLVTDTQEQAIKTQRSSVILEAEASHSVEKMYELSTEATIKSREQFYEISGFLDGIMEVLEPYKENKDIVTIIEEVEKMRQVANDRTAATTNTTITLSDLLQSLHGQSSDLSDIAKVLLEHIGKFKL
jgi:methyl-accepting chemotaxis protein